MKQKFVLVDRQAGKKYEALIDSMPRCPECPEQSFQTGFGLPQYQRHFHEPTMKLLVMCGICHRQLAEFTVNQAGV